MPNIEINLTKRQDEAWSYLTNNQNETILYGGAKGGGKSFLFCLWVYYWLNWLIEYWDLKPTKNPLPAGFIGRKQSIDFYSTTLETWKKIIPPEHYHITEMPHKEITIRNRIKVLYGGLDRAETINKFNSAEYAFYAIDQAEECEKKDVAVLGGSLRLMYGGKKPPYKILYTANPAECFLKEDFVNQRKANNIYVPALYTDNPHLPSDYGTTLDNSFSDDPEMLKAYKEGNWDILSKSRNVITSKMLDDAKIIKHNYTFVKKLIACDPSLGGDECVIYYMENYEIKDTVIGHWDDSKLIAAEILALAVANDCNNVCIDAIGIGEGVVSRCCEFGGIAGYDKFNVYKIVSSDREDMKFDKCVNKRADMWWFVRESLINKQIPCDLEEKARKQVMSVKFEIRNGRIVIQDKGEVRKKIGQSPDRGDCWIYGIYYTSFCPDESPAQSNDFGRGQIPEVTRPRSSFGWT
jgi:hypothetical protein